MNAIGWFLLTCALYAAARALHRRWPAPWLSPLVLVPAVMIGLLVLTGVPYGAYMAGGHWLVRLLAPTTVAFAIPLYRHTGLLRRHAIELGAGITAGSVVAVVSSIVLSRVAGLGAIEEASMIPRSITTPLAMAVAQGLGGSPVLAAVFVIVTAVVGVVAGRTVVDALPLTSPLARGALLGMGAHGAGTATALELGPVEGAVASVVMIGAGLVLLVAMPVLVRFHAI